MIGDLASSLFWAIAWIIVIFIAIPVFVYLVVGIATAAYYSTRDRFSKDSTLERKDQNGDKVP